MRILAVLLICLVLILTGCGGGGSATISTPNTGITVINYSNINWSDTSYEYQEWQKQCPDNAIDFIDFFNNEIDDWQYDAWERYSFGEAELFSPNRIYNEHLINCHYITILIMGNYDGEYVKIDYGVLGTGSGTHAVFRGYDNNGVFYISTWIIDGQYRLKIFRDLNEMIYGEER